jgi:TPR repeat protein
VFNTATTSGKAKQRTRQRRKGFGAEAGSTPADDAIEAAASGPELIPYSAVLDEPPPFDRPDESEAPDSETQDWVVHVRESADDAPQLTAEAGIDKARALAAAPEEKQVQEKDDAVATSQAGVPAATGKVYVLPAARVAPKPRRKSSGLIRVAACLITGTVLVAWHLEQRPQPADAAEPAAPPLLLAPISPAEQLAHYQRAVQQIEAGEASEGAALLRRLAESGFVMAQYRLAEAFANGEGVTADLTMARHWTERAAIGGNRQAMHDLGVFYLNGEGVARDNAAAFRWFRQAADFDLADSQYNLGLMYEQGRGVDADAGAALFWFMAAARQGNAAAAERASLMQAQLTGAQVEQARARLRAFEPRAMDAQANGAFTPPAASAEPDAAQAGAGAPEPMEAPAEAESPELRAMTPQL